MHCEVPPRLRVQSVRPGPARATRIMTAVLLAGLLSPAVAQSPESPGAQAIKYRKSIYQVILWNLGPLSAMAQEKAPYDAKEFATRADRVNAMSYMLEEAYPPESQSGAETRAKPTIWQNRADFEAKLDALQRKSAELAQVSEAGDFGKSRAAFFEMANSCKNCHDEYRAE